jgi:hypothetical protein
MLTHLRIKCTYAIKEDNDELLCTDITDSLSKSNKLSHNSLAIIRIWPKKKYFNRMFVSAFTATG